MEAISPFPLYLSSTLGRQIKTVSPRLRIRWALSQDREKGSMLQSLPNYPVSQVGQSTLIRHTRYSNVNHLISYSLQRDYGNEKRDLRKTKSNSGKAESIVTWTRRVKSQTSDHFFVPTTRWASRSQAHSETTPHVALHAEYRTHVRTRLAIIKRRVIHTVGPLYMHTWVRVCKSQSPVTMRLLSDVERLTAAGNGRRSRAEEVAGVCPKVRKGLHVLVQASIRTPALSKTVLLSCSSFLSLSRWSFSTERGPFFRSFAIQNTRIVLVAATNNRRMGVLEEGGRGSPLRVETKTTDDSRVTKLDYVRHAVRSHFLSLLCLSVTHLGI